MTFDGTSLALCPGCGVWHHFASYNLDVNNRVQLCRDCWLGDDELRFRQAVERYVVWYKGTYGEEAYYEMRQRQEAGK